MNVEFINPFILSFQNVVSTMGQIELRSHPAQTKSSDVASGDVSGIIGMIGPQVKGSMAISFDKDLAVSIMKNMLGEKPSEINNKVRDMIGEMTNMICGGAKNILAEQNYNFEMATPEIVSGNNHTIQHKVDGPKIILTFTSKLGNAYLEICFDT